MLTPREIASECKLNYRTVLRAIESGELPAVRLRGRLRVDEEAFAAWVSKNAVQPQIDGSYDIITPESR